MGVLVVTRTIHIAAPRSAVWAALTESQLIGEWFSDTVSVDMTAGARGILHWDDWGDYGFIVDAADEPSTLTFRWVRSAGADPETDATTLVRFDLAERPGATDLTVVETGWEALPDPEAAMLDNAEGWRMELGELQDFLEKQDSV